MTPRLYHLVLVGIAVIALAACTGSAGAAPSSNAAPTSSPPPSAGPGGGSDPDTGIGSPISPPSSNDPGPLEPGKPTIVVPKPGRLDVHPVGASTIEARVDGRRVTVSLTWWSGVPPCSVLDSVGVARTDRQILLTIREGADQRGVACIELAMLKGTIVDLGELEPGTYTIAAFGEAPPVEVVVH